MQTTTPTISIITVTYNAEAFIESTLRSISSQTYANIESIIVDGLSKDKTLQLINEFKIENTILVSEKDKGLYDAMNKGIKLATGDYLLFLNAGDVLNDETTIQKIVSISNGEDFIYGDTIIFNETNAEPHHKQKPSDKNISYKSFIQGMVICHQSMLVKRNKAVEYRPESYRITADIDWAIRTTKKCNSFKDVGFVISRFLEGGFSQSNRWKAVRERFRVSVEHFGFVSTVIENIKMLWMHLKRII